MKLSQLGEFGLIERIRKLQKFRRQDTVFGIGDDAAALKRPKTKDQRLKTRDKLLLITTDALIEDVHFKLKAISFYKLGRKALLVNISDIAAMGGIPTHALAAIGIPKNIKVESLIELYKGLDSAAKKYQIDVVGGDTVSSPKALMISITLLGEVEKENLLTRSGAKAGDAILVTGKFGGAAAAGFKAVSRLKEARMIAKSRLAASMIDSSDGLAGSVHEICKESRVGARIFAGQVPIAKGATLDQALYGGEEYELVFTAPARNAARIKKMVKCRVVGEIVTKKTGIKLVGLKGKEKNLKNGYDHFCQ